jgi:signal transduction histidine kinase
MKSAPLPNNEKQRLEELFGYDVLDTEAETLFDDLTQLASQICDTPIALVSLIDTDRQWFKSRVGVDAEQTSRNIALCAHAILQQEVFEVPNALKDERFADNPLVTGSPNIRFYAGAPLLTPSGQAIGTLCAIGDKPKTLTDQQREALQTLSKSVMAHLELKRKNNVLARTSKYKSDFLSYISHEIRTPLNAINTFSKLLLEDAKKQRLADSFTEPLSHIKVSGERLLEIVDSVLDINTIEAGKMKVVNRSVNSENFFAHLFALSTIRAEDCGVRFHALVDKSVPAELDFDDTKISQIALNLITNAIKFTPHDKTVSVKVKYRQTHLILNIRDEGIGISEEEQSKLFSPYERMDNAANFKGTGLGLNITNQLVGLLDGEIKINSQLNKGTHVFVKIPVQIPQRKNTESASQTSPETSRLNSNENKNSTAEKFNTRPNVLVIEDHYINQVIIKNLLERLNFTVAIAGTGEDGVDYVNTHSVDFVLMDLNLPGIDGKEAAQRIKALHPRLPIVALTADPIAVKASLSACGLDDVLYKPIDSQALTHLLNKYLNR